MTSEFVQVECKEGRSKPVLNYHAAVLSPENKSNMTRMKIKFWNEQREKINNDNTEITNKSGITNFTSPPSVLIVGIDSISRLHMFRSLPKTKQFLADNDFVEMKGYTRLDIIIFVLLF